MMKRSLQEIEDFYKNRGHHGDRLRRVLSHDMEWMRLVRERKRKLTKKISLKKTEKKKYVLSTDDDYELLKKIKQLEKMKLTKEDRFIVKLIKTQLEHDWRMFLFDVLNRLARKYRRLSRK